MKKKNKKEGLKKQRIYCLHCHCDNDYLLRTDRSIAGYYRCSHCERILVINLEKFMPVEIREGTSGRFEFYWMGD